MKRSGLITGVTLMQLLLGLLYMGVSIFLLFLIRSPATRQANNPAAAVWGLKVAAGVIGPLTLLALVGVYGLWKDRRWGWWVSFLIDLGVASVLVYSAIDDGWNNVDWELILLIPVFVIPIVLLLLSGVRRFYRGSSGPELPPPAIGSQSL